MAVKGVFASDSGIVGDRVGDFTASLLYNQPTGSAPLLALTSGMESAGAQDTAIVWFEENHISGRISVTNNAGVGTTLTVDDATFTVAGCVYLVEETAEHVLVLSVNGNDLTVQRGFAGTSIVALDGSSTAKPIQRLGTAQEQGSDRPVAVVNLGFPRMNYMQIYRNSWEVTGTAKEIEWYTSNVPQKNRRDAGIFHSEDMERSLMYGRKSIGVKNGKPFFTSDGIFPQFISNQTSQTGNGITYTQIRDFLQVIFERNIKGKPNERIAFCGNTVLAQIDTLVLHEGAMQIYSDQTEFGMRVTRWITPFGSISLMTHPLMNENPLWSQDLHVFHPGAVRTRWLRRTSEDTYDKDGTRAGRDADYGVFTSEMCSEYKAETTGGTFSGINAVDTSG